MFKRVISFLLALALVVGVCPIISTHVYADGYTTSDAGVEILKKMEGFAKYPYYDYSQYSVGYGTKCPDEDYARYAREGITEEEADGILQKYLEREEKTLNNFIINKGLNLTQSQFDALVLFSYNCGTSWVNQPGDFHNAVVNGATGESFLYAITLWCNAGGSILEGLINRRFREANMYLNGEYSMSIPSEYGYVIYNAQGGSVSSRVEAYYTSYDHAPSVTATYNGFNFDGWYTAKTGGSQVTSLDASVSGKTLYAHWSNITEPAAPSVPAATEPATQPSTEPTAAPTETTAPTEPAAPAQSTNNVTEITPITVTVTDTVNVRSGAGVSNSIVGSYNYGTKVEVSATSKVGGYTWGRTAKGWICLYYTNYENVIAGNVEETTTTVEAITGYVKDTNNLRVRSGPGFAYGVLDYLTLNTEVTITEKKDADGMTWAKIGKGWVSMDYISLTPEKAEETGNATSQYGVVVNSSFLRIRSGAGFSYGVVGTLDGGDRVEIKDQKYADGMYWGKIDRGWVSMDYISLETATQETPESKPTETPTVTAPTPTEGNNNSVSTGEYGTVINSSFLRIRSGAGLGYDIAGYLYAGNRVLITERKDADGMTWGKIDQGWISLDYISFTSTEGGNSSNESITGTVVNCEQLRVRSGAGTDYSIAGYLKQGEKVSINNTTMVGSTKWGNIGWGWISMDYIRTENVNESTETDNSTSENTTSDNTSDTQPTESDSSVEESQTTEGVMSGTVIDTDELRVRTGAGFSYGVVGYLSRGTAVSISECKSSDGMVWGKISSGWISLDYVELAGNTTSNGTKICVVNTDYLNIRSAAGISNQAISNYSFGDRVEILEEQSIDGVMWGRTAKGWICLDYVK